MGIVWTDISGASSAPLAENKRAAEQLWRNALNFSRIRGKAWNIRKVWPLNNRSHFGPNQVEIPQQAEVVFLHKNEALCIRDLIQSDFPGIYGGVLAMVPVGLCFCEVWSGSRAALSWALLAFVPPELSQVIKPQPFPHAKHVCS